MRIDRLELKKRAKAVLPEQKLATAKIREQTAREGRAKRLAKQAKRMVRDKARAELIAVVRELRASGKSYAAVADRIGTTRNTVVGICWRNGIQ